MTLDPYAFGLLVKSPTQVAAHKDFSLVGSHPTGHRQLGRPWRS